MNKFSFLHNNVTKFINEFQMCFIYNNNVFSYFQRHAHTKIEVVEQITFFKLKNYTFKLKIKNEKQDIFRKK